MNLAVWVQRHGRRRPDAPALAEGDRVAASWAEFAARTAGAATGLREDLRLLVMSATLDGARVARLLGDAPVIESEGRAFPVETRHQERDPNRRVGEQMAELILRALRADPASADVALVALSGYGQAADRERSRAAGFDEAELAALQEIR